jgi:hypothetical protein
VQCSVRNGAVSSNEVDFEFVAPVVRSTSVTRDVHFKGDKHERRIEKDA